MFFRMVYVMVPSVIIVTGLKITLMFRSRSILIKINVVVFTPVIDSTFVLNATVSDVSSVVVCRSVPPLEVAVVLQTGVGLKQRDMWGQGREVSSCSSLLLKWKWIFRQITLNRCLYVFYFKNMFYFTESCLEEVFHFRLRMTFCPSLHISVVSYLIINNMFILESQCCCLYRSKWLVVMWLGYAQYILNLVL